jgi:hypothetical protein
MVADDKRVSLGANYNLRAAEHLIGAATAVAMIGYDLAQVVDMDAIMGEVRQDAPGFGLVTSMAGANSATVCCTRKQMDLEPASA